MGKLLNILISNFFNATSLNEKDVKKRMNLHSVNEDSVKIMKSSPLQV